MNKMTIIGNLTTDPELREVNSGTGPLKLCSFSVAVNERRNGKDVVTYFAVTAWRTLAETCAKYLSKGKKGYVSGPLTAQVYMKSDNQPICSLKIQAKEVEFLSPSDYRANADVTDDTN